MGFDQPKQSGSSGVMIVVVAAALLVAILGIVAVAGVGLFFVRTTSNYSRAVAIAEANQAVAEELRAKGEAMHAAVQEQRAEATTQIQQSSDAATLGPRLNFEVTLDREGNASIDGGKIGLDELNARLAKLKAETSNTFSLQINVDPECPVKHIIPVLDVCKELGDIDFSIELRRWGGPATPNDSEMCTIGEVSFLHAIAPRGRAIGASRSSPDVFFVTWASSSL